MIATISQDARLRYTLSGTVPPDEITWVLYDPEENVQGTGEALPPVALSVSSSAATLETDEALLTFASVPASFGVYGDIARCLDSYGTVHDAIVQGIDGKVAKIALYGGNPETIESCWCPEIEIEIPGELLDATGDGWRMALTFDLDGRIWTDNITFSVGKLNLDISISPREYMDAYPESSVDLSVIESRPDWPRLVRKAVEMVETKLAAQEMVYTAIISSVSLRRSVAAALRLILSGSMVPAAHAANPTAWMDRVKNDFSSVVRDTMAAAYYDRDKSGSASASEKLPVTGSRRLKW